MSGVLELFEDLPRLEAEAVAGSEREAAVRLVASLDQSAEVGFGEVVGDHDGAARAGIGRLLGLPVEHWTVLGGLTNCAWSVLEELPDGRWRLLEHNARSLPEEVEGDEQ